MRVFFAIFLCAIVGFIGLQIYRLHGQTAEFEVKTEELNAEASALSADNARYGHDIEYYEQPENLGKEALKYNRKKPGEELYILVPAQADTPEGQR